MNYKRILIFAFSASLLFSCQNAAPSSSYEESSSISFISESVISSSPIETSSSDEESSSIEISPLESTISSAESSSIWESSLSSVPKEDGTYHFYCVNDFHGSIVEQYNGSYYESGIAKYFGKLKEYKEEDPDHTIILSAGDMFQGSLESNDNYGHLVVDCMNEVGFDAMTLGNHEFDYGQNRLIDNIERLHCPVLGGNIVTYDNGPTTTPWRDDVLPSTMIKRGGNNIGIVGMIGFNQTTSISSQIVNDLYFDLPKSYALSEAKRLREEEGCAIVVLVIHDEMKSAQDFGADKKYFDGVFCGHTHSKNSKLIQGVPFVQSYCNGQAISNFELTIKDEVVSCSSYGLVRAEESWEEDETIAAIRDSYLLNEDFVAKAGAIAGQVEGTLQSKSGVPNLVAASIYQKYKPLYPELQGAFQNSLRAPLTGEISYRDIYKAAPFTNTIVIAKVRGSEIVNQAGYNSYYRDTNATYEADTYYTIACIDYVLYHQNNNKSYNYFYSLNEDFENKIIAEYETYPFDLTFDYIHDDLEGYVDATLYNGNPNGYGASLI